MPYSKTEDLPDAVKKLPQAAQEIYMAAFNAAYKEHAGEQGQEPTAHAIAWAAVEKKYHKVNGKWIAKESKLQQPTRKQLASGVDVYSITCPECHGDQFDEANGHLKCVKCGTMVESRRIPQLYGAIVMEVGKRNAAADEARIKRIIELCQEMLTSGEETEEKVKEVNETYAWLKTLPVVMREDGVAYPAEAYALVPDPEDPDTWRFRIKEGADYSMGLIQKASAYLSPGGYKGEKHQLSGTALVETKRALRHAFRAAGGDEEDMPRWIREATHRELLTGVQPLTEASLSSKGIASVVVLVPGFNSSGDRYYPKEMLARDYKVFEGAKMYADHPTAAEDKARPERSIKDWVATLKNVRVDEAGRIVGEAHVIEPWLQAKLAALRDQGLLSEMGISINAVGSATKATIEGRQTHVIETIQVVRSVDFVTEPGAGGEVRLYEADRLDVDLIEASVLEERRPDIVKLIENRVETKLRAEVQKLMETEEQVKQLQEQIDALTAERDSLKEQAETAEKEKRIAEAQAAIDEAIGKSTLPEASKARLKAQFTGKESVDGVMEAIKAEEDYVAAVRESGKVRGMGATSVDPEEAKAALVEAFKRGGMTDEQAKIAARGR